MDSGASLHMMSKSDMTPEEQETIQKSKDQLVFMNANGTAHTTEEATVCVCDLDMCVQVQLLKESPGVLSLGKWCEENNYLYAWHPSQPSYLIGNWKNIECKTDKHIPLVVPGVQAIAHQPKDLDDQKQPQAVGDHERRVEAKLPVPRILQQTYFKQIRNKRQMFSVIFPKTRSVKYADARKLRERRAK